MIKIFTPHFLILLFILNSCSGSKTLGTKEHKFGNKADHIFWLQISGLKPEHLAMLRFENMVIEKKSMIESYQCSGEMWQYNFFDLRPSFLKSSLSQILGSKKVVGDCSDLDRKPLWSYFQDAGYKIGILDGSRFENSLFKLSDCKSNNPLLKGAVTLVQGMPKNKIDNIKTFHSERPQILNPGIYWDQSCLQGKCVSTLKENLIALYRTLKGKSEKTFIVVRDDSYQEAYMRKDFSGARKILEHFNSVLTSLKNTKESDEMLFLISTSETRGIEFPNSAKGWKKFNELGKGGLYRESSLMGHAFAYGAGAENFCGLYEESDLFRRFIWLPENKIMKIFK